MSDNKEEFTTEQETKEYEDICYICRRPESVAGKMIHIQDAICICNDCMQKTFDSMNTGGFPLGNMMNMDFSKMPNISMINLADLQGGIPERQKLKKQKPKEITKQRAEKKREIQHRNAERLLKKQKEEQKKQRNKR